MAESILMPKLGFDMREGILVRWVKKEGELINKGDVIAEIETDKATVEVESSASGVIRKLLANNGDSVPVGSAMAIVGSMDEKIEIESSYRSGQQEIKTGLIDENSSSDLPSIVIETAGQEGLIKASPLARKVSKEANIDLVQITGTGPGGRIVRRDVEDVMKAKSIGKLDERKAQLDSYTLTEVVTRPLFSKEDVLIQTSKLRQAIGRRLVESKQKAPHFYVTHQLNLEPIFDLRTQVNAKLPEGEKITVNDFIVKSVALALRIYPNLNSTLSGQEILQHSAINVGVAVTVPGGLMTVVVKDTDQKSLRQISLELKYMAKRAREGKVRQEDVEGSTFSTSNLGMYDVENFIAIINPPEAAILAIGSALEAPVVRNGQLAIGHVMKCTISVDHRISDGAEAAQFMQALASFIEDPLKLLL